MLRTTLLCMLAGLASTPARANINEIFAELLGCPDRGRVKASYQVKQSQTRGIKHSPHTFGLRQHQLEATIPLNGLSDRKWKLHLNVEADEIRTGARFPNGRSLPRTLWDAGLGLSHSRILESGRTLAASLLVGSNSDQPFSAARDVVFQGNLVLKSPAAGESAWLYFLNISNNRSFANYLPLPGFAYYFQASDSLRMAVGLPFVMAFWSPFEKAVVNFSYFPLYNGQLRFSYFLFGPAQLYAQARYQSRHHLLSDRSDSRERLFNEEILGQLGFSMPLERNAMVDVSGGYTFDRKVYLSRKGRFQSASGQVLRPEKGLTGSIRLIATF